MKSCYFCRGRKIQFRRESDLKITVKCAKCGYTVKCPTCIEEKAKGFWNAKITELHKNAKIKKEDAAAL